MKVVQDQLYYYNSIYAYHTSGPICRWKMNYTWTISMSLDQSVLFSDALCLLRRFTFCGGARPLNKWEGITAGYIKPTRFSWVGVEKRIETPGKCHPIIHYHYHNNDRNSITANLPHHQPKMNTKTLVKFIGLVKWVEWILKWGYVQLSNPYCNCYIVPIKILEILKT